MGVSQYSIAQNGPSCLGVSIKGIDQRCRSRVSIRGVDPEAPESPNPWVRTILGVDRVSIGYRSHRESRPSPRRYLRGIDRRYRSEVSIGGIDRRYRSGVPIGGIDRVSIGGIDRGTPVLSFPHATFWTPPYKLIYVVQPHNAHMAAYRFPQSLH